MCKITVYITSHNYEKFLPEAIESVISQTDNDWELFLIDDASSDGSFAIMQQYENDSRISALRTTGIGLAKIANLALKNANGKYLIRLDADDFLDENALLVMGRALDANANAALVAPDYYMIDAYGDIFMHHRNSSRNVDIFESDLPPHGACSLMRVSALRAVGGYDEHVPAQDGLDIWMKLKDKYDILNTNLPLFYYRRHDKNLTENQDRIFNARRQIKANFLEVKNLAPSGPINVILPCRKYYDFTLDLWSSKFQGESLLAHNVRTCLDSRFVDNVIVACDNPKAASVLDEIDDPRLQFRLRPERTTLRTANLATSMLPVVSEFDPGLTGCVMFRALQTPFISSDTINEALNTLLLNECDSAVGVEEIDCQLFKRSSYGLTPINRYGRFRTDFDIVYRDVLGCIALRAKNLKIGSLYGTKINSYVVPRNEIFTIKSTQDLSCVNLAQNND